MTTEEAKSKTPEIDRLTAMKAVAVNMAVIEVMQLHRVEIITRAKELLAEKGITVKDDEIKI